METTPNAKSIQELMAKNVRAARKRLGISQMKLAAKLDLSAGYMNDVERARRWVGAGTLARLADVLHLKPYQFFVELPSCGSPPIPTSSESSCGTRFRRHPAEKIEKDEARDPLTIRLEYCSNCLADGSESRHGLLLALMVGRVERWR